MILLLEVVFWVCLGAIVWTHVGYPLFIALLARVRPRPVAAADILPTVTFLIPAYNEEAVIERKLDNTLALDYPRELMEIVVTSDASSDRTHVLVEGYADRGVQLLICPRGGKMPALDRATRQTTGEIICMGDANTVWDADSVRRIVRPYADPEVGMVTGQVQLVNPNDGSNQEGIYWRYEMWVRTNESAVHSETASNGAIHSIRRSLYKELEPADDHDISFPYHVVQQGSRAVYEPAARCVENMTTDIQDEYGRKSRFLEHCWLAIFRGSMWKLTSFPPVYAIEIVSAPVSALPDGPVAHRAAGRQHPPGRPQHHLRGAARRPAGRAQPGAALDGAGRARAGDQHPPVLPGRHLGDVHLARPLPAARRAGNLGGGVGDAHGRMSGLYERHGKRLLDLAAIVIAAPVAAPLLAGIAAAVAATDGRPVLFRQARVGKDGREFTILKFRTMRVGTEHHGDGYWGAANDCADHAGRQDPAVDVAGRAAAVLVNVLVGDMSLVGPRPKPREIVERYRSRYAETLRVRPGLTCLWAIRGRNELRRSQLIELDQEYVRDVSLLGDLRILVETVPVVLLRRGFFTEERTEGWMEDLEPDAR